MGHVGIEGIVNEEGELVPIGHNHVIGGQLGHIGETHSPPTAAAPPDTFVVGNLAVLNRLAQQILHQAGESFQALAPVDLHSFQHVGKLGARGQGNADHAQRRVGRVGDEVHQFTSIVEIGQDPGNGLVRAKRCPSAQILVVQVQNVFNRDGLAQRLRKAGQHDSLDDELSPLRLFRLFVPLLDERRQMLVVGVTHRLQLLVARAAGDALGQEHDIEQSGIGDQRADGQIGVTLNQQFVENADGSPLSTQPGADINQGADQRRVEGIDTAKVVGRQVVKQGGPYVLAETGQRVLKRLLERPVHPLPRAQHAFLDNGHQLGVGQFRGFRETILVVLHSIEDVLLASVLGNGIDDIALFGHNHPQRDGPVQR